MTRPSRILVDTDVVSYIAARSPQAESFGTLLQDSLLTISFVTVGEMFHGAAKKNWGERRILELERLLRRYTVIPGTYPVAKAYGQVKRAFQDQVDENDMWIAATAIAHELPVATNNLRHFEPMGNRLGFEVVHPDRA